MATVKMPKTMGETIDLLFSLREDRKVLEAQIKVIAEKEGALEAHLMTNFDKAGLDGAKGKFATAALKRSTVGDVQDWPALWEYVRKNKAYDMIQKRLSVTAARERWDAGKQIPGVEPKEIVTLSITKVGGK